ncbi:unnamed protein product [[Actinomadura] parvosata subsp. kistnae]|nr:unnamed protein product [Actinomadura parvosata subsp. kistnae]
MPDPAGDNGRPAHRGHCSLRSAPTVASSIGTSFSCSVTPEIFAPDHPARRLLLAVLAPGAGHHW